MEKMPKELVFSSLRAICSIILVIVLCTAVSGAGVFLASRYGLTQSREQVPLTALSIGNKTSVTLPQKGEVTEGEGWILRNSRGNYTLTLDGAVIEGLDSEDGPTPGITVTGDLTMELKEGSGNWIRSNGAGIRMESGLLSIRGRGKLEIQGHPAIESDAEMDKISVKADDKIRIAEGALDNSSTKIVIEGFEADRPAGESKTAVPENDISE